MLPLVKEVVGGGLAAGGGCGCGEKKQFRLI
jgi:hypothetical protein